MPHRRTLYNKILAELRGPMQLHVSTQIASQDSTTGYWVTELYVKPRRHSVLFGHKIGQDLIVDHLRKNLDIEPYYQTRSQIYYARNSEGKVLRKGDIPDAAEKVFVLPTK